MGNFISRVADRATLVAAPRLWIEGAAIQQLSKTLELPGMVRAVGMPDLHPGRGYPIGAAFFTAGRFYPALVGGDIGCGVSVWTTELPAAKVKLDKLDKLVGNLDGPLTGEERQHMAAAYPELDARVAQVEQALADAGLDPGWMRAAPSLGSGNHFLELQRLEDVLDPDAADDKVLNTKHLNLVVHTGSRGLGGAILREHVEQFGHGGLAEGTPEALDYVRRHQAAVAFAELNRWLVAVRVLVRLGVQGSQRLDVNHNTVTRERFDGADGWVHRKGATPMSGELVLIPGSRDHFSYLVRPIGEASESSLGSLAHGAGRKWMRADCKARLGRHIKGKDVSKGALGSRIICNDKDLVYEEAGAAYKPIDTVIDSLVGAGLVEAVASFRPVLTYKTRGECC
ncbi:RNA ligase RtcB family protein [Massilia sp. ZL223]|uniref:RNA ligase RtcB family protein n=1 Tax=Massilia sp. ZL223 TaxID=2824904 RepID=UPI001B844EB3|nr:RNA ligase RtcB family protein [Massilia sp. ZL223]MBQ5964577.1 RNA ligase RtcB family protein [Massilia sp. ZL223]